MLKYVKKIWGNEEILVNNDKYCSKFLNLEKGYECSLHYHKDKDETFYILGGIVELDYIEIVPENIKKINTASKTVNIYLDSKKIKRIILKHGDQFRVKPYLAHRFRSITSNAKMLEVSTPHKDNDSYRITNSRKIEGARFNYGLYK